MLLDTSTRNPSLVKMTLFEGLFTLKSECCNSKEKSLCIRVDEPPMTLHLLLLQICESVIVIIVQTMIS